MYPTSQSTSTEGENSELAGNASSSASPRIPQSKHSTPSLHPRRPLQDVVNLAGEVYSVAQVNSNDFKLSPTQRTLLLSCEDSQSFCLEFFRIFGMQVHPQIRICGKSYYVRLSVNNGEYVFEESLVTFSLSRMAVSIKAVKMFNPEIARDWLQKYKKQRRAIAAHFD